MKARFKIATAAAAGAVMVGSATPAFAASSAEHTVRPGQSIQAAIDAAAPGSTVRVAAGVYRENLLVAKPLTLRGVGHVVLRPSATIARNACTNDPDGGPGFDIGICVTGTLGPIPPGQDVPVVISPVSDVRLSTFEIRDFTGGIITLGTHNLRIDHVEAEHTGDGIFVENGDGTVLDGNSAHDNAGGGIQLRSVENTRVMHNRVSANKSEGVLLLDSHGGVVAHNTVTGNCAGIAVIDTGTPGIAGDLLVAGNTVRANNLFCPGDGTKPAESGVGIGLVGTTKVTVWGNRIADHKAGLDPATGAPAQFGGAGLLLLDGSLAGGAAPTGNRIIANRFNDNTPLDVLTDGMGSNNRFAWNTCENASLPGVCH